jgi:hypothetical protein
MRNRRGEVPIAVTTPIIGQTIPYFGALGQAFFPKFYPDNVLPSQDSECPCQKRLTRSTHSV